MIINGGILNGGRYQDQSNGFLISSSDFTQWGYGGYTNIPDTTGYQTTYADVGPGWAFWAPEFGSQQGTPNPAKRTELLAYWAANGLTTNGNAYMFNVSWGPGSTLASGVVIMGLYDYSGGQYTYLNFGVVDTSNPIYLTPSTGYYNGPIKTLVGTWNLPATFSVITPLITDGSDWC